MFKQNETNLNAYIAAQGELLDHFKLLILCKNANDREIANIISTINEALPSSPEDEKSLESFTNYIIAVNNVLNARKEYLECNFENSTQKESNFITALSQLDQATQHAYRLGEASHALDGAAEMLALLCIPLALSALILSPVIALAAIGAVVFIAAAVWARFKIMNPQEGDAKALSAGLNALYDELYDKTPYHYLHKKPVDERISNNRFCSFFRVFFKGDKPFELQEQRLRLKK